MRHVGTFLRPRGHRGRIWGPREYGVDSRTTFFTILMDFSAHWAPLWEPLEPHWAPLDHFGAPWGAHWLHFLRKSLSKSTSWNMSRFSSTFSSIFEPNLGGPTCNPIEPARSKRMSALFPTSPIFIDILMDLGLQNGTKTITEEHNEG